VNFAAGRIPFRGKSPQNVYSVPAHETVKHRAKKKKERKKKERKKKERQKTETTAAKYNGMPNPIGRP